MLGDVRIQIHGYENAESVVFQIRRKGFNFAVANEKEKKATANARMKLE